MNTTFNPNLCLELAKEKLINVVVLHYNMTGRMTMRSSDGMSYLNAIFIFISIAIILENLFVLTALLRYLRLKRWVYCCLANIAVSDLLAGVSYLLNICLSGPNTFLLSPQLWFVREGLVFTTLAASIFSLLITAVERYSTMVVITSENHSVKSIRVHGLIALCWILAGLVGFLPLIGWNCVCNIDKCSNLLPLYAKDYLLFSLILLGVTLVGITGFYCTIYYLVCTSAKRVVVTSHSRHSFHLLHTVIIILGTFIFCWSPLFVVLLMDTTCSPGSCTIPLRLEWVLALALLNSALNPLIYSFRSSEVRKAVLALLCSACTWAGVPLPVSCRQGTDITSGSSNESSLRRRSSVRLSRALSVRSPLTSISSVPSQ
uniref:Sphingosine-1-phosphate receptor 4 n=1 Tax=Leptobrachium leishanense TaxID=445787 RepID=A0A8C5LH68_9ANUR